MPYTNDIEGTQTPDSKQETNDMNATTTKPVAEPYSKKVGENFLDWINQEDRLCTVLLNTGDRVL